MGKYQAYPEYKDSGVEWIGEIPTHWNLTKIRYVTECLDGKRVPLNATERGDMQGDIPYWGANSIVDHVNDWLFDEELVLIGEDGAPFFDRTKSVAFNVLGKVWPNNHVHVLRPIVSKINPKYLTYSLNNVDYHLYITGSTRDKLNQSDLNAIIIRYCPTQEQESIANFLDHETAKIDTLIKKQQQLIQLLKEKRQAVISHAVTKGLNPNAPMKDSGVEWLGDVPEHWIIKKFSHCVAIRNGLIDPTVMPYKDYVLIAPNHIESETGVLLSLETANEQGADSGKYLCKKGEVIYSKIRPALAKACMSPNDETICSADMYPMQGMAGLSNEFLFLSLLSNWFTSLVILESDRVAMPKINREKLADIRLPIPPRHEQEAICLRTKAKISSIDHLLDKAFQAIVLMQERRTALISAAVTGKIDVRHFVSDDAQAPQN